MARARKEDPAASVPHHAGITTDAIEASLKALGVRPKIDQYEIVYNALIELCRKNRVLPNNGEVATHVGMDSGRSHAVLKKLVASGRVAKQGLGYLSLVVANRSQGTAIQR